MANLTPEKRINKHGVAVIKHVKTDDGTKARLNLPKPLLERSNALGTLRLKDLDSGGLTLALLSRVRELEKEGKISHEKVLNALDKATFLHRDAKRGNRKNLSETPYIEHPLRNALRSLRWGCTDEDVIVAIILHDTVEDCVDDIVRYSAQEDHPEALPEATKREIAMEWVANEFGPEVARLVLAVSNPITEDGTRSPQQKREEYADHVGTVINGDAKVFLVKVADFVDNATGLHHNNIEGNRDKTKARARKYLPVLEMFEHELATNPAIRELIDDEGYRNLVEQFEKTRTRLQAMV